MAEVKIEQADHLFEYADLQIKNEITQAWEYYMDYCRHDESRYFQAAALVELKKAAGIWDIDF